MPDLDQLLTDAAHDDAPVSTPALDAALNQAQASTRRRHVLLGGATTVAIALCGGLVYAGTATGAAHEQPVTKLAAYDHVVGRDKEHPGHVLVVGPADAHTSDCTKVPDTSVTVQRARHSLFSVRGVSAGERIGFPAVYSRRGPYYLFSCPTS